MRGSRRNKIHPQLSDPSPRYSRNIHTLTRGKTADSAGFPPSPSPCTPLVSSRRYDRDARVVLNDVTN